MKHFKPEEFGEHFDKMDPKLFEVMDDFREVWGFPIRISPHPDAIARTTGRGFHNYVRHGSVKAIDLMPVGMYRAADFRRAYVFAVAAGATGIGIYPDWKPQPGIHIDVGKRKGRPDDYIAKWSAFKNTKGRQVYYGIEKAFNWKNTAH